MSESQFVLIRIPTPLRGYTGGADMVTVSGDSVGDALAALGRSYPGILERVLDDHGHLRQFVNIYLGSANIRTLEGLRTHLESEDILAIIPAVAGGVE